MPSFSASNSQSAETSVLVDADVSKERISEEICSSFLSQFAEDAPDFNCVLIDGYENAWTILRWMMQINEHDESAIEKIVLALGQDVRQDLVEFVFVRREVIQQNWPVQHTWFTRLTSS